MAVPFASTRFQDAAPCLTRTIQDSALWYAPGFSPWRLGIAIALGSWGAATAPFSIAFAAVRGYPGLMAWGIVNGLLAAAAVAWCVVPLVRAQKGEDARRRAARLARGRLAQSLQMGRLGRDLHPEVVAAAEEAAIAFRTIQGTSAEGSSGISRAHAAARGAMDEVILVLSGITPDHHQARPIGEMIGDFMGQISGRRAVRGTNSAESMAIAEVGRLARDLGDLAAELERAHPGASPSVHPSTHMRDALAALRQERDARDELDRELRA